MERWFEGDSYCTKTLARTKTNERLKQHTNCLSIVKISPKRVRKHARAYCRKTTRVA